MKHYRLNFVCMGNICRSPLARCIFEHLAQERNLSSNFTLDSCGTSSWESGKPADPRSVQVAAAHGLTLVNTARQLRARDFEDFDLLLAMDLHNISESIRIGGPFHKIQLLRSYDPLLADIADDHRQVPDPYHGGDNGFELGYQMIERACVGLLDTLSADKFK